MCTRIITLCCLLATSTSAVAANRSVTLYPNDVEALKAARIVVTHRVLNGSEHAFEITAEVPEGFNSLDATFGVRSDKGLVAHFHWQSSAGKCVVVFMVGEQALKDAVFTVEHHKADRFAPFADRVGYVLKLSEFASDVPNAPSPKAAASPEGFEVSAPIAKDGATLKVAIRQKDSPSNWHYDVHITTTAGLDQHVEIRSGQPLTPKDVRLADLTADGFLDIMVVGGKDHRGEDWFRTVLYDPKGKKYRWITGETFYINGGLR
jgi:hypothetical protein